MDNYFIWVCNHYFTLPVMEQRLMAHLCAEIFQGSHLLPVSASLHLWPQHTESEAQMHLVYYSYVNSIVSCTNQESKALIHNVHNSD